MDATHVPGPWVIRAYEGEHFVEIKADNGFRVIAGVPFCNGVRDANARLISAAPDLLEACIAAKSGDPRAYQLLPAAIAKATGATPDAH